jgi:hypothetical protein
MSANSRAFASTSVAVGGAAGRPRQRARPQTVEERIRHKLRLRRIGLGIKPGVIGYELHLFADPLEHGHFRAAHLATLEAAFSHADKYVVGEEEWLVESVQPVTRDSTPDIGVDCGRRAGMELLVLQVIVRIAMSGRL